MVKRLIALDPSGFPNKHARLLEETLGCSVVSCRELLKAKEALETGGADGVIINPYADFGPLKESYVEFLRTELVTRQIPAILFTRKGLSRIRDYVKLIEGVDYKVYVKKPCDPQVLVDAVRKAVG